MADTRTDAPAVGYAEKYLRNQNRDARSRWRTGLERRALRRSLALAGYPQSILDLPCGTGRFWPTLAAHCDGELVAADIDPAMLAVAEREWPAELTGRFRTLTSSGLDIDAPDDLVDTVVSMRFLHHLARPEDRRRALTEMSRVARRTVIVSLWTDRSLSAWWQHGKSRRNLCKRTPGYGPRVCVPAGLFEWEAGQCGLDVIGHRDVLPGIAKWRLWVLGVRS
ncbi:MAG: class I SAM-dependent methyltransferase [Pseudomonadales bacterium]